MNEATRRMQVGAFLCAGVLLLVAVLFVLGRAQGLFVPRVALHTAFRYTAGLSVGAPVRLAGVDVGTVQGIRFAADPRIQEVSVALRIDARHLARVRADSVASLVPKGLLGDMTVNITVGSASATPVEDGATLASSESEGLTEMVADLHQGLAEIGALSRDLRQQVGGLFTPELARDVGRIAHSAAHLAEAVETRQGLAHALLFDEALARDASAAVRDAGRSAAALQGTLGRLDRIVAAVESGDGTLHALIYRDDARPVLADVQRAARDLADTVGEVRRGKGLLHALVFPGDGDDLVANLAALSRILKSMGENAQRGQGTVGALLVDPTVYEDLKVILGNVKRNRLLKALVRFTIERDGLGRTPP